MSELNPAAGGLVDHRYVAEAAFGSTPASPTMKAFETTRSTLGLEKSTFGSEKRSSTRQRKQLRHGYKRVSGDLSTELASQSVDDFLEATLGGTFASAVQSSTIATSTFTANSIAFAGYDSLITDGLKVGDIFDIAATGYSGNTRAQILAVDASTITTTASILSAGSPTSVQITRVGNKVGIGNTKRSFSIEEAFDNGLFRVFTGCRVNSMALQIPTEGNITIDFSFEGQDQSEFSSTTVASAVTPAPNTDPMAAVEAVLLEGATAASLGTVTGMSFTVNNNMSGDQVVGRDTVPSINFGRRADITGTITVLFDDATTYNKFVNETESAIDITLYDGENQQTANFLRFRLEPIKFTGGNIDTNADTSIPIELPFEAIEPDGTDASRETTAIIAQRSN